MATAKQIAAAAKKAAKAAGTSAPAAPAAASGINYAQLATIVAATLPPGPGFTYLNKADTEALVAAGLVEVREDIVQEGTTAIATRATEAGQKASADAAAAPVAPPAPAASPFDTKPAAPAVVAQAAAPVAAPAAAAVAPAASSFAIVGNVPCPAAKRFGKASVYPFDALAVNQAFFVPATAERPKPAKSMASTVNSATGRYMVIDGKEADGVTDKYKETRKFVLRNIADGEKAGFGAQYKGVSGAGVWRIA